jgi:hypothetical protein
MLLLPFGSVEVESEAQNCYLPLIVLLDKNNRYVQLSNV